MKVATNGEQLKYVQTASIRCKGTTTPLPTCMRKDKTSGVSSLYAGTVFLINCSINVSSSLLNVPSSLASSGRILQNILHHHCKSIAGIYANAKFVANS